MTTIQDIAAELDGMQYYSDIDTGLRARIAEAGFVVVIGASDDLMETFGAVVDEFPGTPHVVLRDGRIALPAEVDAADIVGRITPEFAAPGAAADWTFKTDIPRADFRVMEEGAPFCVGFVFDLKALTKRGGLLLAEADDRDIGSALLYKGQPVMEINYDEHGSGGQDLIEQVAGRLSEILGEPLQREYMSDADYRAFMGLAP